MLRSGSEFVNVAIIAPRDVARSQDNDRFEFASNKFRSILFGRFGQKIHQKKPALREPRTVSFCRGARVDLGSLMVKSAVLNDCLVHDGATLQSDDGYVREADCGFLTL